MPNTIYSLFVWRLAYPEPWDIVSPYTTAQFISGSKWKELVNNIDKLIYRICWSFDRRFRSLNTIDREKIACHCGNPDFCYESGNCKANCIYYVHFVDTHTGRYENYVKDDVVNELKTFLRVYRESAFVILALMYMAHRGWWGKDGIPHLPDIEGKDPIEVLHTIKTLNDFMRSNLNYDILLNYFGREIRYSTFDKWLHGQNNYYVKHSKSELEDGGFKFEAGKIEMPDEALECVRFLKTTVTNRWEWFVEHYEEAASEWMRADDLTRSYLLTHACYTAYNDVNSPGSTQNLESALVCLLKDTETRLVEENQREIRREEEQRERERIEKECAREIAKISYAPPDTLDSRVLKDTEIEELKKACLNKLDLSAKATLMVIDDFVNFCTLLSKPENHIKKPTGQYVEKEVPLRTEADMVGEMRRELTGLPNFTAYAKVMQVKDDTQTVAKHKINTPIWYELPVKWPEDVSAKIQQEILDRTYREYCQKREIIEMQIRQKQAAWQKDLTTEPLSGRHN